MKLVAVKVDHNIIVVINNTRTVIEISNIESADSSDELPLLHKRQFVVWIMPVDTPLRISNTGGCRSRDFIWEASIVLSIRTQHQLHRYIIAA